MTFLLMDVDGVLNILVDRKTLEPPWKEHLIEVRGSTFSVALNPEHGPMLEGLAKDIYARLVWHTMWESRACTEIAPRIGLNMLMDWVPNDRRYFRWDESTGAFKARNAFDWMRELHPGEPFIWVDDEQDAEDELGRLMYHYTTPWAVVCTDDTVGFTEQTADEIQEIVRKWGE